MTFGELKIGDCFKFGRSFTLIWQKMQPFTAYGIIKNQNAAAKMAPGPWHYDRVSDDTQVEIVSKDEFSKQMGE
jgi:hypothetical protein